MTRFLPRHTGRLTEGPGDVGCVLRPIRGEEVSSIGGGGIEEAFADEEATDGPPVFIRAIRSN